MWNIYSSNETFLWKVVVYHASNVCFLPLSPCEREKNMHLMHVVFSPLEG